MLSDDAIIVRFGLDSTPVAVFQFHSACSVSVSMACTAMLMFILSIYYETQNDSSTIILITPLTNEMYLRSVKLRLSYCVYAFRGRQASKPHWLRLRPNWCFFPCFYYIILVGKFTCILSNNPICYATFVFISVPSPGLRSHRPSLQSVCSGRCRR